MARACFAAALLSLPLLMGAKGGCSAGGDVPVGYGDTTTGQPDSSSEGTATPDSSAPADAGFPNDADLPEASSDSGSDATTCVGWCTCPAGEYWIEVQVNDEAPIVLRAGYPGASLDVTYGGCGIPIAFGSPGSVAGLGACLTTTASPPCVLLGDGEEGLYSDPGGQRWPLKPAKVDVRSMAADCASPQEGVYEVESVAADADGGPVMRLHGSFRACPEGQKTL